MWRESGGKFTKDYETPEYKEAVAYHRALWDAGVFHRIRQRCRAARRAPSTTVASGSLSARELDPRRLSDGLGARQRGRSELQAARGAALQQGRHRTARRNTWAWLDRHRRAEEGSPGAHQGAAGRPELRGRANWHDRSAVTPVRGRRTGLHTRANGNPVQTQQDWSTRSCRGRTSAAHRTSLQRRVGE